MMPQLKPTPYHTAVWEMTSETGAYTYRVTQRRTGGWAAGWWSVENPRITDGRIGATLDEVLHIFPTKISNRFRMVVNHETQ